MLGWAAVLALTRSGTGSVGGGLVGELVEKLPARLQFLLVSVGAETGGQSAEHNGTSKRTECREGHVRL